MSEINFDILIDSINQSQRLIDIMLECENNDGYCIITQKELATRLNKSQSLISKLLRRLSRVDNCIEIIEKGKYKVHYRSLSERGPYVVVYKLISVLANNPELIKLPIKQIAINIGMPIKDIEMAYGYITGFNEK